MSNIWAIMQESSAAAAARICRELEALDPGSEIGGITHQSAHSSTSNLQSSTTTAIPDLHEQFLQDLSVDADITHTEKTIRGTFGPGMVLINPTTTNKRGKEVTSWEIELEVAGYGKREFRALALANHSAPSYWRQGTQDQHPLAHHANITLSASFAFGEMAHLVQGKLGKRTKAYIAQLRAPGSHAVPWVTFADSFPLGSDRAVYTFASQTTGERPLWVPGAEAAVLKGIHMMEVLGVDRFPQRAVATLKDVVTLCGSQNAWRKKFYDVWSAILSDDALNEDYIRGMCC